MKHLIIMCTILSLHCSAQEDTTHDDDDNEMATLAAQQQFEGRLILGTNFCQLNGDTYAGYHKIGLNMGAMVYVRLHPLSGISLELLYAQKGVWGGTVKESYTVGTYFDKYYLDLNYLQACIMFHYKKHFIDYEAGIAYSRLITSREDAEADVPVYIDPARSRFNSYDLNYVVGLSIPLGERWCANARFEYSVVPVRTADKVYPRYSDGSAQFNEVTSLRFLYRLRQPQR